MSGGVSGRAVDKRTMLVCTRRASFADVYVPLFAATFSLLHVETLEAALQKLQKSHREIDIVAVGVYFNESRMFDLLRACREKYPDLPVIIVRRPSTVLSEVAMRAVHIAGEALGAAAFLDLEALMEQHGETALGAAACEFALRHVRPK